MTPVGSDMLSSTFELHDEIKSLHRALDMKDAVLRSMYDKLTPFKELGDQGHFDAKAAFSLVYDLWEIIDAELGHPK